MAPDAEIEIAIPGGEKLAERTLNGRLGIVGGLSILGTTGIVVPYSCAAWIDTIHRGIDVARAMGLDHVAGATGSTSEAAVQALYGLSDPALIDMGDFVGGMLKYLRRHPVPRVTVAGGVAKMTKLAQGLLDLHSKRGEIDLAWLADRAGEAGASPALHQAVLRLQHGRPGLRSGPGRRAWTSAASWRRRPAAPPPRASGAARGSKSCCSIATGAWWRAPARCEISGHRAAPAHRGTGDDIRHHRGRFRGSSARASTGPTRIRAVRSIGVGPHLRRRWWPACRE